MHRIVFTFLVYMLLSGVALSQSKDLKQDAAFCYDNKDYKCAYELYDKLSAQNPKVLEYKFRLGVSSINYPEKKARSIEIFEELSKVDKTAEINFYLGKAYHINYRFDEALNAYNDYVTRMQGVKLKEESKAMLKEANLGIENCTNGKTLINQKVVADIKNIGLPINTNETEGVPVISADESVIIFTYAGRKSTGGLLNDALKPDPEGSYHEDIFISVRKNDSVWSEPTGIAALNTKGNDAAVALSPDGQTLFSFISNNDAGDLFTSSLTGTEWSKPVRLNSNINTPEWEGSCSISSDGRFLYFASERPGGLGGRDLYVSEKINGDWGPAVNLGPSINTEYNEDAPFIHPDGITLFFSSEGHKSIGGYDIMYSIKQDNQWIEPLSMGIPLNTTEDDRFYVINAKGDRGYFSSNRGGAGGKGGQDIYSVEPGILGEKPVLALLKGSVFADDKPIDAKIEVSKKATGEAVGPYYANAKTGKYLMALTPGNGYKIHISVSVPGFEPIDEEIDVQKLQKFVEIRKDFYLYSPAYANKRQQRTVSQMLDSLLGTLTNAEDFKNDAVVGNPLDAARTATVEPVKTSTVAAITPTTVVITPTVATTTPTTAIETPTLATITPTTAVETPTPASATPTLAVTTSTTAVTTPTVATATPTVSMPGLKPCDGGPTPDFSALKGKSLNVPENYSKLLEIAGNTCAEGLVFKVQIAAYKYPENYKYDHLKAFGKPEITNYPDGITRFTQLQFTTLKEAEAGRQQIIGKGQTDAWITAVVNGKRYTLEELIMVDFLGKAVN